MEYELSEDSRDFLDSLSRCTQEELKIRSGKSLEHLTSGHIEHRADTFFHRAVFDKIQGESLRRAAIEDRFIEEKVSELEPLITTRSFSELHVALVEFVYKLMIEMDDLYVSMCSIYNRCRSQASLADITSDVKRIRELKVEQPSVTIKDILNIYKVPDKAPECISRFSVSEKVVREAMRRIGADNYGPRAEFAEIINAVIPEDDDTVKDQQNESEHVDTTSQIITPHPNLSGLSGDQIDNLQSILKKLIQNKLKK